jgi:hypothetical protein
MIKKYRILEQYQTLGEKGGDGIWDVMRRGRRGEKKCKEVRSSDDLLLKPDLF